MPDFRVEVDAETEEALQVECDLLGFETPEAYLSWIVDNRAAIEQGTESARLLEAYRERLRALEARLDAAGIDPGAVDDDTVDAVDVQPGAGTGTRADDGSEIRSDAGADPSAEADPATEADTTPEADPDSPGTTAAGAPGATEDAQHPDGHTPADATATADESDAADHAATDDADAAGATAADAAAEGATVDDAPADSSPSTTDGDGPSSGRAASDGGTSVDDGITSMHLRPERVQRVSEDPVTEDAGVLADVATDRLDELSRRAVAETRRRLDRDPETGLEYDSSATLPGSTVRPGADVADLDAIEVPGRSGELVERRREAVGRALALLRDEGRARRSDFVAALYEEYPAGYETADGWWRCVRGGLDQVGAVDGGHVWEYEG